MADNTLTRAGLVERVHSEVGLSRADSSRILDRMLDLIADELTSGEDVKLSGFGSFFVRHKGQRIGRNPRTREEVPIAARDVVIFRASALLRDRIARGD